MHDLVNVDCPFTCCYTLVDEAAKLPTILSNELPDLMVFLLNNRR